MNVPQFKGYFPSIDGMNCKQREFYREVQASLSVGDYIDIDGNVSYVFVYLYS
ncbi:hypothetical protein FIV04_07670 [Vibrio sp. THAF190c]|nr:hypothetical protein FIV04_07670 [Vibrio sp. THAF190c]